MLYAIATLLITSSAAPLVDELTPPPWPKGMRWERRADGILLNDVADKAVHERLEWSDRVPELGAELLGYQLELKQAECDGARAVDAASHAVETRGLEANQATLVRKLQWVAIGVPIGAALVLGGLAALGAL